MVRQIRKYILQKHSDHPDIMMLQHTTFFALGNLALCYLHASKNFSFRIKYFTLPLSINSHKFQSDEAESNERQISFDFDNECLSAVPTLH